MAASERALEARRAVGAGLPARRIGAGAARALLLLALPPFLPT